MVVLNIDIASPSTTYTADVRSRAHHALTVNRARITGQARQWEFNDSPPLQERSLASAEFGTGYLYDSNPIVVDREDSWNKLLAVIREMDSLGSGTDVLWDPMTVLRGNVERLLSVSSEEDGWESEFNRELARVLDDFGSSAVSELAIALGNSRRNPEIVEETLVQIGSVGGAITRESRRTMLRSALRSPKIRTRHAAASGMAALDDANAVEDLRQARDRESSPRLRNRLDRIIIRLEERTRECRPS